jgi:uncharacterized protein YutE (UPF0331/DUF86 family)
MPNVLLVQKGIVDKKNLDTFRAIVRFRNFLVHAYEDVDDSVTYAIYKENLIDFLLRLRNGEYLGLWTELLIAAN